MSLSVDEYNRRVTDWMRGHWPSPVPCPLCQTTAGWQLLPTAEIPLRTNDVEGQLPGKAIPVVPLICRHCAHIVTLSAVAIGVLEPDPEPTEQAAMPPGSTS